MKTIRMPLTLSLAALLGAGVAMAHEDPKKPAGASATQHSGHEGMDHSMAGMGEGSKQLHMAMMQGHGMPMKMTGNVDTDFATMMTMHHQQAIKMSDVLLKHGKNAELRALAQKMKASQLEEIRKMAPHTAQAKKK